jgi:hypothetical protein
MATSELERMQYVYMAMAGETQQGGPGCTYVDMENGRAFYVKSSDLLPITFRDKFQEMQEDDDNEHFFVVTKESSQLHIFKYARASALTYDWTPIRKKLTDRSSDGERGH